jgi:hypothetical protein
MLRFLCVRGMHICIPACMHSRALQVQKSHTNKNEMQNFHVVSRPFHVLFNGALVLGVSLILMYLVSTLEENG